MTMKEIATEARVSYETIKRWRREFGDFPKPYIKDGSNSYHFERAKVIAFLSRHNMKVPMSFLRSV